MFPTQRIEQGKEGRDGAEWSALDGSMDGMFWLFLLFSNTPSLTLHAIFRITDCPVGTHEPWHRHRHRDCHLGLGLAALAPLRTCNARGKLYCLARCQRYLGMQNVGWEWIISPIRWR
jgi:hypothetical protein